MASSSVGGLSGAFIPVSEDRGMIDAVRLGALTLDKLEAMTSICSVGLDMVAIPGDTPPAVVSGILADQMAIGVMNSKTTAARLLPIPGSKPGDIFEWGGLLETPSSWTSIDSHPRNLSVLVEKFPPQCTPIAIKRFFDRLFVELKCSPSFRLKTSMLLHPTVCTFAHRS